MAAPRPPEQPPEWGPDGFPPRSFPPGGVAVAPGPPPPGPSAGRGRGAWLAAGAGVLAVLLLLGVLIVATRDDDGGSQVATDATTSSSGLDTSVPTFASTTAPATTATSTEPVSTTSAEVTTTTAGGANAGSLQPALSTVTLPKADASVGPVRGTLVLRNAGGTALTYTTQSSSGGLAAAPAGGTIGPGGSSTLTITLDAARIDTEGAFTGTLSFGGTGGTKTVEVKSTVGRPPMIVDDVGESCAAGSSTCSRLIKLAPTSTPDASPCNTPWLYSVTIRDQSQIQSAKVTARQGIANADASLRRGAGSDIFQSDGFTPLPSGTVLRFAVEAVDQQGFSRRLAEQSITCP